MANPGAAEDQRCSRGTHPSGGDPAGPESPSPQGLHQPSMNSAKAGFGHECAALHFAPLPGCVGAGPGWHVAEFSGLL